MHGPNGWKKRVDDFDMLIREIEQKVHEKWVRKNCGSMKPRNFSQTREIINVSKNTLTKHTGFLNNTIVDL